MSRKRYSAELLIGQLRQAEILVSGGKTIAEVVRQLNISEQTYYRRRKEYGGLDVDQARRLSVWLRTRPWISPFSRRRLGETSEPGVSGSGPGSADAALHTKGFGRRSGTDGKHCLSGIRVWMNTPARVWQSR